jgi:D-sedoheptulose 7-phosphate isomerase
MTDTPRDFSRELYPFLYNSEQDSDASLVTLFAEVRRSTLDKCADVMALRHRMLDEYETQLSVAATAMAERFSQGGKLIAFGNGGSATDADDAAIDCLTPSHAPWTALPALSLPADGATGSAVANDVGIEHVFVRQIVALGESRDIALGISTSGRAANVVAGLAEAKRRGMLTIALTGYDGGAIARDHNTDFCFVARHEFVPRIQEGHATMWHCLLALVQDALGHQAERVV